MCDILLANIHGDKFLEQCKDELEGQFRGLLEVRNPFKMASELYNKPKPKLALLDADDQEIIKILEFIKPHVGYLIAFTDQYNDANFIKFLYKHGFNDVRPKKHLDTLAIAIRPVIKKRQNFETKIIKLV